MQPYIDQLLQLPNRVLATTGPQGVNVVPVSVVTASAGDILLYDFFMGKTIDNIRIEPAVAIAGWDGLVGIQLKGTAQYEQEGEDFLAAVREMSERFPDRTLRGIIRLTPQAVYSVSAGPEAGRQLV